MGIGISSWGWNAITFLFVAEMSDRTKTATSVGLATAFGWLGMSLGPVVFGSLTDCFGYFYAWMSLAVFCTFSLLLCLLLPGSVART
jgi:cyanate permease